MKANKVMLSTVIGIMAIAMIAAAAVFIANINATATVSEAFSTATTDVDYSGYAGETICEDVDVNNAANVDLDVEVSYVETSNVDGVVYTTNMPITQTLAPGANVVTTCVTYDGASPLGDIAGTVTINRI